MRVSNKTIYDYDHGQGAWETKRRKEENEKYLKELAEKRAASKKYPSASEIAEAILEAEKEKKRLKRIADYFKSEAYEKAEEKRKKEEAKIQRELKARVENLKINGFLKAVYNGGQSLGNSGFGEIVDTFLKGGDKFRRDLEFLLKNTNKYRLPGRATYINIKTIGKENLCLWLYESERAETLPLDPVVEMEDWFDMLLSS